MLLEFPCVPVGREIAERAGSLRRYWSEQGGTRSVVDTVIGAAALSPGASLMTRNLKEFPAPELSFYPIAAV